MKADVNKHIFTGMHRDLADDKESNQYYYDALNIRIDTNASGSLMAVINLAADKVLVSTNNVLINGNIVGDAVINDTLVLFTKYTYCNIYKITFDEPNGTYTPTLLYSDSTGTLVHEYVKDVVVSYENEDVQKVYWTDGYSQPKVINIANTYTSGYSNNWFDFIRPIGGNENIVIEKLYSGGSFPAGTVQYFMTYFNLYGQESKVFYQSPIMYASDVDNANEPNTSVSNSFKITASDLNDSNWEYVRIYCLSRTSTDTTPSLRLVTEIDINGTNEIIAGYHDISITYAVVVDVHGTDSASWALPSNCVGEWNLSTESNFLATTSNGSFVRSDGRYLKTETGGDFIFTLTIENHPIEGSVYNGTVTVTNQPGSTESRVPMYKREDIEFIDNGLGAENVDPSILLYVGGNDVTVQTLSHKDMTLFAGNIELNQVQVPQSVKDSLLNPSNDSDNDISFTETPAIISCDSRLSSGEYYKYTPQLDVGIEYDSIVKKRSRSCYKWNESYRFGVQFMDKLGQWSEPVFLKDFRISAKPLVTNVNYWVSRPKLHIKSSTATGQAVISALQSNNFIKARPVVVLPTESEREVICQGVLNPTVFNVEDRANNAPFAQASWFFRPSAETYYYRWSSPNGDKTNTFYIDGDINPYSERNKSLGTAIPFQHCCEIKGANSFRAEIQAGRGDLWTSIAINTPDGAHTYVGKPTGITDYTNYNSSPYIDYSNPSQFDSNAANYVSSDDNKNTYYIDQHIVTLNSPDIDFNDNIINTSFNSLKFRVVGAVNIDSTCGDINILTSSASQSSNDGFWRQRLLINDYNDDLSTDSSTFARAGRNILANGMFWFDKSLQKYSNEEDIPDNGPYDFVRGWVVYPFQRNGSISNDSGKYGVIKSKIISNLRYCSRTIYRDVVNIDTNDIGLFNSEVAMSNSVNNHIYFGNSDKILADDRCRPFCSHGYVGTGNDDTLTKDNIFNNPYEGFELPHDFGRINASHSYLNNYKLYDYNDEDNLKIQLYQYSTPYEPSVYKDENDNDVWIYYGQWSHEPEPSVVVNEYIPLLFGSQYSGMYVHSYKENDDYDTSTIPITYRSSQHAVIELGSVDDANHQGCHKDILLPTPTFGNNGKNSFAQINSSTQRPFWDEYLSGFVQDGVSFTGINRSSLLIGELYREMPNKFGGTSDYALSHNVWNVAGEAVDITNDGFSVFWDEGDTYFQRYDCLKTMPLHNDDINQIVEILSFMCETRVNIDGRYDTNRGLKSNLLIDDTNFNLINKGYTQNDNFFQYNILDERFNVDKFPNQITWTLNKVLGAKTDNWSSLTMANTLDLDGDKGEIVSLNRFANDIYSFQPKGIAQILYNVNAQISTANGLPIELANSGKVSGKRYLTENNGTYGSQYGAAKSVVETSTGLYFYDKVNNNVCVLNGNGVTPLSDKNLMKSILNPLHDISFVYDKANSDVHVIDSSTNGFKDGEHHLVYNELVGQFTTFLDRTNNVLPSVGSMSVGASRTDNIISILENYCGGTYLDSAIEFVENKESTIDKVFTNLEFRTDDYRNGSISINDTFNSIKVYNDYQSIDHTLSSVDQYYPLGNSNIARKFRVWRVQIGMQNGQFSSAGLERIIGTWAKIRLEHNNHPNDKLILYDAVTKFYMH